ncbi:beta-1,3-galactosyltransferase 5 isoform X2 [Amyelois transitella]|uniref:beta-1,3-galactosyltransferase 5 isoform X2 n=1 Tax=Amyelois transitella TaxID=680683 RepID=UPI0029900FC9|nr:beta-1,3-galactosyltransferase 5 isoform X2 [Amyelois transitella]
MHKKIKLNNFVIINIIFVFLLSTFLIHQLIFFIITFHVKAISTGELYVGGYEKSQREHCSKFGFNLQLLIIIPSDPKHFAERAAIRNTWGRHARKLNVPTLFITGAVPDYLKPIFEVEEQMHGDIIIGHFVDHYLTLTLKTISMVEWVRNHCHLVPKLLKVDDDVSVNIPKLMDFVINNNASRTMWGNLQEGISPRRVYNLKSYVSTKQYPGRVFPNYLSGPTYLLTTDVVKDILDAAPNEPYMPIEDVFITGVLANKLGIHRKHIEGFCKDKTNDMCEVKSAISIHGVTHREQFEFWEKIVDAKMKCEPEGS